MAERTEAGTVVLGPGDWHPLRERHRSRVAPVVQRHLERRRSGARHPVEDFLFTYYSFRPAALQRWHPGFGVALAEADEYALLKGYGAVAGATGVTTAHVASQRAVVSSIHALLTATSGRTPNYGCFGMHEWAMVYRLPSEAVRHADWPLRLGAAGTDEVVDSHRIACSHFDAFRFFTDPARKLNVLNPGRDDRPRFEQPACLHAGMDLYKHASRLVPMVSSELVADCFDLAREIRVLDMRASPYDLQALGYEPVRIETPAGKQEYMAAQRHFADRAVPLRQRLVTACERFLAAADTSR